MNTLPKVGRYDFLVEPFHCDFSSHLFIGHMGNAMLNAADYHSTDRGYGVTQLGKVNKTWVLSRLAIEINEMPKAYDKLAIETWVDTAKRYFTGRNFAVVSRDNAVTYAYGRSIWAMIDTETRQPGDLLAINDGLILGYVEKEKPCPVASPSRVNISHDAPLVRQLKVYYSDVDINGHVNSVRYIEHILDLFPLDDYRSRHVQRIDIAYVAESHAGDTLNIYCEQAEEGVYNVRMTKQGEEETEVVRARVRLK